MNHRAFTLLELIIVLSIMVAVMGMSWPRMRRAANRAVLREAALQVKAGLAEARDRAVRTGQRSSFSFQQNGTEFVIATTDLRSADSADESLMISVVSGESNGFESVANESIAESADTEYSLNGGQCVKHSLPEPVTIASVESDDIEESILDVSAVTDDVSDVEADSSQTIAFFPDGRGSAAQIRLGSADTQEMVVLTVRALTGDVTIGDIERDSAMVLEQDDLSVDPSVETEFQSTLPESAVIDSADDLIPTTGWDFST
ncbi:pilus assembly FimT family protein [Crateriforma conspicua]|uniref:General secretion pathway GspH domain-containing protein n=1 Tax=Crateriforma conspicua TaxID=2527996 RepID=A0A5C5Y627_9PLAN|nr:type II secretion system protein [Crateriforma conspicua]QDV64979.1 hypothetical protein Mal65_41480 [Crateriforma conspicua]TWT70378.1 hypothetical protein Pan14r_26840 [Crateriforma conspicua]